MPAIWLALSIFALNLPLLIVARVLAAHQKSALANLWNMVGSLGNLVALLVVIWFRGGSALARRRVFRRRTDH